VFVGTDSSDFSHGILAFAVNTDGSLTSVNTTPIPTGSGVVSLVSDRWGQYLYALTAVPGSIEAYAIDQNSGALTSIPGSPYPISTGDNPFPSPPGLVDPGAERCTTEASGSLLANYPRQCRNQPRHGPSK
jgi:hypothetical protein